MRVVKTGSGSNEKWAKKVTCPECHSVLEIGASDLWIANTAVFYAGETWEPCLALTCTVCKSTNYIADSSVPSGIRNGLYDKALTRHRRNS